MSRFAGRPGTLEQQALDKPGRSNPDNTVYDIYRSACINDFEISPWSRLAGYD